jgi:hypothetical protein
MLTLARRGKIEEEQLQEAAREYLWMYVQRSIAAVPFKDLTVGRVRFVVFEKLPGVEGWTFVDITD